MGTQAQDDMATLCERSKKVDAPQEVVVAVVHEVDSTIVRPLHKPTGIGDVIAEKYRLVRTLGRGGMGRIFAADHLLLGTTVALKFMHPHLARERGAVARFKREARAAAVLKSSHAARIIDVDQLPSGELYIVMEYLDGASLETMAVDGRGLPINDAVSYLVQACDALAEAHEHSIVHRDVKPANLFLTRGTTGKPLIKVLDFGLAKSTSTDGYSSTGYDASGGKQALGTPHYMAPEQITGATPVDGRSDVWAIGATLYELLTGHLAFGGPNAAVVFDAVLKGTPTPLRVHRPDVSDALVAIVERCLTRDQAGRFQTVRELAHALESSRSPSTAPVPWRPSAPPLALPPKAPPMAELIPFVAAPLTTARFVSVPAPAPAPALPVLPVESASVRACILSLAPPPPTEGNPQDDEAAAPGPTARQTFVAALAGPALIAIAAGVMALVVGTDVVGLDLLHPGQQSVPARPTVSPSFIVAKGGGPKRAKLPAAPEKTRAEKTDRLRK